MRQSVELVFQRQVNSFDEGESTAQSDFCTERLKQRIVVFNVYVML